MKYFFSFSYLLIALLSNAQGRYTLSGTVRDASTNETLIGVSIKVPEAKFFTATNEYGFYSLSLPQGTYQVIFSMDGYGEINETITLNQDIRRDLNLNLGEVLQEVVIDTDKPRSSIGKAEMSVNKLSIERIKQMPVVLGEVDVLKSILLIPGVTNAGEGSSGFNVRGGGADQNLILLDEATIFNASHVFGFFSVFNPDAIKDLKLYKGGIPARFGGRASSVLDIYQKEGNANRFTVNGGIGLISSRLLAEGPLEKQKGSFLIGGRASYGHLFLKLSDIKNSAYFYDLNLKLNYKLNNSNSVFVSSYFGRDVFDLSGSFKNIYGNGTLNMRWNHLFSDRVFSNLSFIYSDYYYGLYLDFIGFRYDSEIKNYNIKYDLKAYLSHKINLLFGTNAMYYLFNPGTISPLGANSGFIFTQLDQKYAFEPATYVDVEHNLTENMAIRYGARFSGFYRLGSSSIDLYTNNQPVIFNEQLQLYEKATPIGSKRYGSTEIIQSYGNIEPRISFAYTLSSTQSVKASYHRMVQYLQLVSNTASPTPLDVWTPSDNYIKPQLADQVALGYFLTWNEDQYGIEVETFYKKVKNRIDYIDGADLIANDALEQVVLNGEQRAYGLELLLRKNQGKLTGWLAYTLSRSEQRTPGRTQAEPGINNGQWYRTAYDKTHNLAVTANYSLSQQWQFGVNFIYQTGQPVTFPNGQYQYQDITVPSYGLRNKNSLPAYHHVDLSATYTPKKKKKDWQGEWVFSVYNVYNRRNAASIRFNQDVRSGANEAIRFSIFGAIPAISYNFKF